MSGPTLNRVVADFTCESTGGKPVRLKDLRGQNVVLYFYPKDSTPGCTQEGKDFTELHTRFRRQNTRIFGVSRDSLASHEKSLYGRKFMGVVRSTFLIDADGKLRGEWRKVKVKGHAAAVLEAVKELAK